MTRTGRRRGAADHDRELPADFPVVARLFVRVTDDVPAARDMVRQTFAPYVATPGYNRFYAWMGYDDMADAIATAARARDRDAMAAAFTDDIVDDLFVLGDLDTVVARIGEYVDAGVTVPALQPITPDPDETVAMLRAIAGAWDA